MILQWHHLLGIGLTDVFSASRYQVELEKELSLKRQRLDYVIIERQEAGQELPSLPDGLDTLRAHNLLTYKSHHESINDFVLDELIGHYVNYLKQLSPDEAPLLPAEHFQLLAVSARRPDALLSRLRAEPEREGLYRFPWGSQDVTLIVCCEVEPCPRNALWMMFSASEGRVFRGLTEYHARQESLKLFKKQLYNHYHMEGFDMGFTIADYEREYFYPWLGEVIRENAEFVVSQLSPGEWLKRLPPEERIKDLLPEELLKAVPPGERVKGLPPEELLKAVPPGERIKGMTRKQLLELIATLPE
ncbi:MAG: hypothetical protein ACKO6N_13770 [Myxococcota bacterium]